MGSNLAKPRAFAMTETETAVILATDQYLLEALVTTRGQRLLEVLNDPTSDFLRVLDFKLISRETGEGRATMPTGIIRRSNLVLAMLTEQHEAPQRRQYSYVEKKARPVVVIAGSYLIEGDLQFRGKYDPVAVVNAELQSFFPVTNAVISHSSSNRPPMRAPVAIVNKQCLWALHIGDPPDEEQLLSLESERLAAVFAAPGGDDC
jgi:hypothetical protein